MNKIIQGDAKCISCEWTGRADETVHLKHDPDYPLCPNCYDTVELDEPGKGDVFEKYWGSEGGRG